jgi:predicted glycosyl hydrolase (DUF1957 family)
MTGFDTYRDAAAHLPTDTKWSSSFGYPGEGGYCEFHRDTMGKRYTIQNGTFGDAWTISCVVER